MIISNDQENEMMLIQKQTRKWQTNASSNFMNKKYLRSSSSLGKLLPVLGFAVLFSGCTQLTELEPIPLPIPDTFPAGDDFGQYSTDSESPLISELNWESVYKPNDLQLLIKEALINNRSLAESIENLRAARSAVKLTNFSHKPRVVASVGSNFAQASQQLTFPNPKGLNANNTFSISVPSFELDFFGTKDAELLASQARAQSLEEANDAIRVSLIAEIANIYASTKAAFNTLDIISKQLNISNKVIKLLEQNHKLGAVEKNRIDLAKLDQSALKSQQIEIKKQIASARQALGLIVGRSLVDDDFEEIYDYNSASIIDLKGYSIGLPSQLLFNRPDIKAAEQQLIALNADVTVAKSTQFPTVQLSALLGRSASTIASLFSGTAASISFGANSAFPIFPYEAIDENIERVEATRNAAVANYEKVIQNAFKEVADALILKKNAQNNLELNANNLTNSQAIAKHVSNLHENGAKGGTYFDIATADSRNYQIMAQRISAQLQSELSDISIYRSIGGGSN